MKILLISSYLPYPLYDGGRIRLYNLLKFLKDQHEITLVCETREDQTENDIKEVEKICKKVVVFRRPKAFSIKNTVKSVLTLSPFLTTVHTHKEFSALITRELGNEKYDLIHVETFYVMQNLPKTNVPIVLVEHNIEYKVYERFAKKAPIFSRPILFLDALNVRRIKQRFLKKEDAIIAVSPTEQKNMGGKSMLVPN